ncbi:MAG: hypothetical protein H6Q28_822 [Bacteroidetes bacterium]|nr:hypothetical protein [Bacteroidota bacterium]
MNRLLVLALGLGLVAASGAAQKKPEAKPVTIRGYVVDQMCAVSIGRKADPMARAAKHTRECSFHPECASSGFGIFADGKFTKFDTEGSAKALKALQVSKREKGMYYEVTGTMEGDQMAITSLREIDPPK